MYIQFAEFIFANQIAIIFLNLQIGYIFVDKIYSRERKQVFVQLYTIT